jgi:hypothetical protein
MPAYVVYRPSVMRSGRLAVRVAAVAALLIAAVVAFVVITQTGGHPAGAPSRAASRTAGSSAGAAKTKAVRAHTVTATSAKRAHVAKGPAKPVTHVKKKTKAHAAIPAPRTTPVAVLNGGTAQGAAAALAAHLRSLGYPVPVVGNAGRRDLPMAIEYAAGLGPAARALARQVGSVQYVTPLEGPNRNLSGARLLVIIGN